MKKIIFGYAIVLLALQISCSKKNEADKVKDCEKNNYGIVTLNFNSSTVRHGTLITNVSTTSARDKISGLGIKTDTLHLEPGNYILSISTVNADGQSLNDPLNKNISVLSTCQELVVNVAF